MGTKLLFSLNICVSQLEGEKNKLENLLSNNLTKKRDRLLADMQEASLEEKNRKLDKLKEELATVDQRLSEMKGQNKGVYVLYVGITCPSGQSKQYLFNQFCNPAY